VHFQRQQRLRVLEALELEAKQFRTREELFPLRIPREPLRLDDIVVRALGEEAQRFDPSALRSRTILRLEWPDSSAWTAWVIMLPSQLRLFCDSGAEETRVLASGGRNAGDETDRQFLTLLAETAGDIFGIEMSGGPPARVRSSIADRAFLVDVFVTLFEVRGMEDEIRRDLADLEDERIAPHGTRDATTAGSDFRVDIERWLELVAR
jgi:hypothetical protein